MDGENLSPQAVRQPTNTTSAESPPAQEAPTAESLGWQLRAALPPLRLHSVSLYDDRANILWLSEGALGPDEHAAVLVAMRAFSQDPSLNSHESGLEDGRLAMFLPVRTPQTVFVGLAMILADNRSVGNGVSERLMSAPIRTILQKLAIVLRLARTSNAKAAAAASSPPKSPPAAQRPTATPRAGDATPARTPSVRPSSAPDRPMPPAAARSPTRSTPTARPDPAPRPPSAASARSAARPSSKDKAARAIPEMRAELTGEFDPDLLPVLSPEAVEEMLEIDLSIEPTLTAPRVVEALSATEGAELDTARLVNERITPPISQRAPTVFAAPRAAPPAVPPASARQVPPPVRAAPVRIEPTPPPAERRRAPPSIASTPLSSAHQTAGAAAPSSHPASPVIPPTLRPAAGARAARKTAGPVEAPAPAADSARLLLEVEEFSRLRAGGRTRRFEVLARSREPRSGPQSSVRLDRRAFEQLTGWLAEHRLAWNSQPSSFTMNLCIETLEDERFPQFVASTLRTHGIAADMIGFEIAEPLCLQHRSGVERFISVCDTLGCFVVIDDFSMDSALKSLLRSKALRLVKIDPRLTTVALKDKLAQAMCVAIAQAVKVLGIHCAAKQVDSSNTLQWLTAIGCDFAQGPVIAARQPIESLAI
jgi:EAL domain-containing protein (putative c-di-GMP-specific phosphodiesterase class I)